MTEEMQELERRLASAMNSAMTAASDAVAREVLREFRDNIRMLVKDAINSELRTFLDILTRTANSAAEAIESARQVMAGLQHLQTQVTQIAGMCPKCGAATAQGKEAPAG